MASLSALPVILFGLFLKCFVRCEVTIELSALKNHFSYEEVRTRGFIFDSFTRPSAFFHFIPDSGDSDQLLFGAKNWLFTMPVPRVSGAREVLEWRPSSCARPRYRCPYERSPVGAAFACGNHIRFVLSFNTQPGLGLDSSGRSSKLLVCGSHGGRPKCHMYRREVPRWLPTGELIDAHGVVSGSLCPNEKNPFYFDAKDNSLFVSGFAFSVPALAKYVANDTLRLRLYLREAPFFQGPRHIVSFHSLVRYKEKVFLFFNEEAYEEDFNTISRAETDSERQASRRKRRYARVARVCSQDQGSEGRQRWRDQFSSFFKARLVCRDPSGFLFDHLVALSEEPREAKPGTAPSDPLIRAVFASDDGLTRHHGVCAFRMSQVERGINEGHFVEFHRSPAGNFLRLKKSHFTATFMACRAGRSSQSIARFAHQFPLKSEPILNSETYPSFTFTANRFNVTALVADRVDGREVLFLGTDSGLVVKLANVPDLPSDVVGRREKFSVVDSVQLFPNNVAVLSLLRRKDFLVAVSKNSVLTTAASRCGTRKSCRSCILLRDPHCSWNAITHLCARDGKKVGSVREGLRYCSSVMPTSRLGSGDLRKAANLTIDRILPQPSGAAEGLTVAVGVVCSVFGFVLGCLLTCLIMKRCRDRLPRHLLQALRQKKQQQQQQQQLGNEKATPGPKGATLRAENVVLRRDTMPGNEYDDFLEHRRQPSASVPLDKKLNNEAIKNTLLATLDKNKSCDSFL